MSLAKVLLLLFCLYYLLNTLDMLSLTALLSWSYDQEDSCRDLSKSYLMLGTLSITIHGLDFVHCKDGALAEEGGFNKECSNKI